MSEVKILTPIGMLGYGVDKADFLRGIDAGADAIIVDSGSTDPGPYQLGLGTTLAKPEAYVRDLRIILSARADRKIPVLIGSAGGPGTAAHVDDMVGIVRKVGAELGLNLKIVTIYADVDKQIVNQRFAENRIQSCASAPALKQLDIDESGPIVAQMGAEPFLEALQKYPDVDVIVAGRAYDPSPFAAFCALHGIEPGIYWHMGKIMECGGLCAEPKVGVMLATVRADSFDLEPMTPDARCTTTSVAAHTLYEKTRPDLLPGPGGVLDLGSSRYEQITDRAVRVSGSQFRPSEKYQVKLESAACTGYRTIFIGGVRDPILIGQIDDFLDRVRKRLSAVYPQLQSGAAQLNFQVYGKNAVMGAREPMQNCTPHEVGILGEITAPTQELADAIASHARIGVLHLPYPGQMATGGNFAIPLNPPETSIGPVFRFSIYHLMDVETPLELFPIRVVEACA